MLEANTDDNILKRAIMRRLDNEPGVNVLEIVIKVHKRHIAVGILWQVDDKILGKSVFDVPLKYHLSHVINEADEIAEQCKEARRNLRFTGAYFPELGAVSETFTAKGTGRRGRWRFLDGMT